MPKRVSTLAPAPLGEQGRKSTLPFLLSSVLSLGKSFMLETLSSAEFRELLEQDCIAIAGEAQLLLVVAEVSEYADSALPNAKRKPFRVLLRGPESPTLSDGLCGLRTPNWFLPEVYLNRVMPRPGSAAGAYYQLIFSA